MNQQEFNFLTPDNRKMNVISPVTGKVYRAFDKYNVLGVTGILELKKTKKKSK